MSAQENGFPENTFVFMQSVMRMVAFVAVGPKHTNQQAALSAIVQVLK